MRDGRTYSTRLVTAQQDGKVIFMMMVGLAAPEVSKLSYQMEMPNVPPPEQVKSQEDRMRAWLDSTDPRVSKYHEAIKTRLSQPIPIDIRPLGHKLLGLGPKEPKQVRLFNVDDLDQGQGSYAQ